MRFTFIHAADLHIDSPLAALGVKDADVAARFAAAGRQAVRALIKEVIASKAAFLIIAGDIFDREWRDVTTGLFFVRELGELHRAGIPTYIIKGNHDAKSVVSKSLPYPDNVFTFDADRAETMLLEQYKVALHGRSFGERLVPADFVSNYPARKDGWLNIGLLHTGLDGTRGHESYAPCSVNDLAQYDYDYWALGHIHAGEIVSRDPWIVYPGILQGRSVRETGPKGAVRVSVEDGKIGDATPIVLDGARWGHAQVDLSSCDDYESAKQHIADAIEAAHAPCDGRALALRLTLVGTTALHSELISRSDGVLDDARALGLRFADDCWIEKVKVATQAPVISNAESAHADDGLDLGAMLRLAADDPEFAQDIASLFEMVRGKLPVAIRDDVLGDVDAVTRQLQLDAPAYLLGGVRS